MILKANQRLSTHLNQSVLRGWLSEELTRSSPYSLNWFVAPTLIPIVSAVQNQLAHQKYNLITMCPFLLVKLYIYLWYAQSNAQNVGHA
jgi:hypothetical protein